MKSEQPRRKLRALAKLPAKHLPCLADGDQERLR
jgi:hypothetical protein